MKAKFSATYQVFMYVFHSWLGNDFTTTMTFWLFDTPNFSVFRYDTGKYAICFPWEYFVMARF